MGPTKEQQREKIREAEKLAKILEKDYLISLKEQTIRNFDSNDINGTIDPLKQNNNANFFICLLFLCQVS